MVYKGLNKKTAKNLQFFFVFFFLFKKNGRKRFYVKKNFNINLSDPVRRYKSRTKFAFAQINWLTNKFIIKEASCKLFEKQFVDDTGHLVTSYCISINIDDVDKEIQFKKLENHIRKQLVKIYKPLNYKQRVNIIDNRYHVNEVYDVNVSDFKIIKNSKVYIHISSGFEFYDANINEKIKRINYKKYLFQDLYGDITFYISHILVSNCKSIVIYCEKLTTKRDNDYTLVTDSDDSD